MLPSGLRNPEEAAVDEVCLGLAERIGVVCFVMWDSEDKVELGSAVGCC